MVRVVTRQQSIRPLPVTIVTRQRSNRLLAGSSFSRLVWHPMCVACADIVLKQCQDQDPSLATVRALLWGGMSDRTLSPPRGPPPADVQGPQQPPPPPPPGPGQPPPPPPPDTPFAPAGAAPPPPPPEPSWAAAADDRAFNRPAAKGASRARSERRRSRAPGGPPPDPAQASPPVNVRRSSQARGGSPSARASASPPANEVPASNTCLFGVIQQQGCSNGPNNRDAPMDPMDTLPLECNGFDNRVALMRFDDISRPSRQRGLQQLVRRPSRQRGLQQRRQAAGQTRRGRTTRR